MIGAILSKLHWSPPDGTGSFCFQLFPPIFAFILSLINMIFSYHYLPETLVPHKRVSNSFFLDGVNFNLTNIQSKITIGYITL